MASLSIILITCKVLLSEQRVKSGLPMEGVSIFDYIMLFGAAHGGCDKR